MRVVCSSCQRVMKCSKTGRWVVEMANFGPYKIWSGDEFQCPFCGICVVTSFGAGPVTEHFMDNFVRRLEEVKKEGAIEGR